MSDDLLNIEINGVALQARKGAMIIEVADQAGIRIPRFCYHEKLSIAANCRMCLVEVEKAPKPLPACATPVMEGMKVFTRSPRALSAQKGTMEFLLINHPLDCPICDQGGECELQDVAMGYGGDVSRYNEGKRVVLDYDIGPLIETEMTRCIHCTRCVRFGEELAGIRELGATGRGENTRIGTYIAQAVTSEMSGNVIDLCPVGALTAKPSRYSARAWELRQSPSVAAHDCVGSNIHMHSFRGRINRVVPRDNEAINECWLSDRDRFAYEGLNSDERLTAPMIRKNGVWEQTDWDSALHMAVSRLQEIGNRDGIEQLGILVSPNATLEEMHLLNRIAGGLSCNNIDHRVRQSDFTDPGKEPVFPSLGRSIESLEHLDAGLLIGSNVRKEQPIIAHRIRKAAMRGARIMFVNTREFDTHFHVEENLVGSPARMVSDLAAIAKSLFDITASAVPESIRPALSKIESSDVHLAIAEHLKTAEQACVIIGPQAQMSPYYTQIRFLAEAIAGASSAGLGYLTDGANTSGAWISGLLPHRDTGGQGRGTVGLDVQSMMTQPRKAYLLHQLEAGPDFADPAGTRKALNQAECVVCLTSYVTEAMKDYADVLLPVATHAETSGTYINIEGKWQSFPGAVNAPGEVRPAWKVLRVLGNLLNLDGFEYVSSEEILRELQQACGELEMNNSLQGSMPLDIPTEQEGLSRISGVAWYHEDPVVRRARSLRKTPDGMDTRVRLHPQTAARLGLEEAERIMVRQADGESGMSLEIDAGVPENCVWVPMASDENENLGPAFGPIELEAD
jgi:NADH-quinone oxidoreductase subunit G